MRRKEKTYLNHLLVGTFALGLLLGLTLASVWVQGYPTLMLASGENMTSSIAIVGVNKTQGTGMLVTLEVELRSGDGSVLVKVPPFENEDTQQAMFYAKTAAANLTKMDLSVVDLVVSVENIEPTTTIAGPSAGAATALLMVSAIRTHENESPNRVRDDVVISASIDSSGRLGAVGDIQKKYDAAHEAGVYTTFVVAETQPLGFTTSSDLTIRRVRNLSNLADLVLW